MARRRRCAHELAGAREAARATATLGLDLRRARRRRRWTLAHLADLVGISPTRIHELESGQGASAPLATWFALGSALGRPFGATFTRESPASAEPADAGHLAAQEIVLRFARAVGRVGF